MSHKQGFCNATRRRTFGLVVRAGRRRNLIIVRQTGDDHYAAAKNSFLAQTRSRPEGQVKSWHDSDSRSDGCGQTGFRHQVPGRQRQVGGSAHHADERTRGPGLIEAARLKTGLRNDSDLINAALALIAAPDDFGPWFASQAGRLPKDFELEL